MRYTIKTGSLILFNVSKIFFIKYVDIVQMSVELCIHELHTIKIWIQNPFLSEFNLKKSNEILNKRHKRVFSEIFKEKKIL